MRIITIDCATTADEAEFWAAYVAAVQPEGSAYFGRNLAAFWDAVSAGGPGWPGEDCELRFINAASLKQFAEHGFYDSLKSIAARSEAVCIKVD